MSQPDRSQPRFRAVARPQPDQLPEIPLPIYPRSCGRFIWKSGETEYYPPRNFVQLYWGVRGCGEFFRDNRPTRLEPEHVFYRLPGEAHIHRCLAGPWEYRWIAFDGPDAARVMNSYHYPKECFHAGTCPGSIFDEFEWLLHLMTPYCWRKMVCCIMEILALAGGTPSVQGENSELERIIRLCREHFRDCAFNVNTLADLMGMHRSTLRKLFLREMHRTPSEYIQDLRSQHALELLRDPAIPLRVVAEQSGFAEVGYFCRAMKRLHGTTPSRLRNHA